MALAAAPRLGIACACNALNISPASFYRYRRSLQEPLPMRSAEEAVGRLLPKGRTLNALERASVLSELVSERFRDLAPRQVYATLAEEGIYLCSIRTMYRILASEQAVLERRPVRHAGQYRKPELLAVRIKEVWTWDITLLKGPLRGVHYYLYVVLDIYSRYVVGWRLADRECQHLAAQLLRETCQNQGVEAGQLCLHADRGSSMKSQTVETLLLKLGVAKSHSRPHVSDDNPFSEAAFKTLKYCPLFPARFGSLEEAEAFCQEYFAWYNERHHHSGLVLLTPAQVHYGDPVALLLARHRTILAAYAQCPARFGYRPSAPGGAAVGGLYQPPGQNIARASGRKRSIRREWLWRLPEGASYTKSPSLFSLRHLTHSEPRFISSTETRTLLFKHFEEQEKYMKKRTLTKIWAIGIPEKQSLFDFVRNCGSQEPENIRKQGQQELSGSAAKWGVQR